MEWGSLNNMKTEVRRREIDLSAPIITNNVGGSTIGMSSRPLDAAGIGLILISTVLWASQGIGVKFGLTGFTPYTLLAIRAVLAAAILITIVGVLRLPFPRGRTVWLGAIGLGIFQVALSGSLFFWALQHIPVGRATIFASTQPFLTVIAAHFLVRGENLTVRRVIGLMVGFAGVVVAVLSRGGDLGGTSTFADGAVILAACIWTAGSLVVKKIGHRWHTMSLVTVQMVSAAVVMTVAVLLLEPNAPKSFTAESIGGLVYLATFGSVGAFFMGYYVIRRHEVSLVSSFVFLQPVVAVFLGALLLGEQVTWPIVFSLSLVALGLIFINHHSRGPEKPAPLSVGRIPPASPSAKTGKRQDG
jgi:drug/metabolite transporter (DMT)-like permease